MENYNNICDTLFDIYRISAKQCIRKVNDYISNEVLLSRREKFDYLFKVYSCGSLADAKKVDATSADKVLAKYYAGAFLRMTDFSETGYSLKEVKKFFSTYVFNAWTKGISNGRYKVAIEDKNGVIFATLKKGSKGLYKAEIRDVDDLVVTGSVFIAFLGSELEDEDRDKEFIADYLIREVSRYKDGKGTKVYVDTRKHNLKDTFLKDEKNILDSVEVKKESEKVVSFRVANM